MSACEIFWLTHHVLECSRYFLGFRTQYTSCLVEDPAAGVSCCPWAFFLYLLNKRALFLFNSLKLSWFYILSIWWLLGQQTGNATKQLQLVAKIRDFVVMCLARLLPSGEMNKDNSPAGSQSTQIVNINIYFYIALFILESQSTLQRRIKIIILILQIRKSRHREVKWFTEYHTDQWQTLKYILMSVLYPQKCAASNTRVSGLSALICWVHCHPSTDSNLWEIRHFCWSHFL